MTDAKNLEFVNGYITDITAGLLTTEYEMISVEDLERTVLKG